MKTLYKSVLLLILGLSISCISSEEKKEVAIDNSVNETEFVKLLTKHLKSVSDKDLATLKTTLPPNGIMQLILPKTEIKTTVQEFIDYHEEWFALDNNWTFETKILNYKVSGNIGFAITEVLYKEPLRDGKPYFNRMTVSYDLEKINNEWYVIKDHASSIEKSTDKE